MAEHDADPLHLSALLASRVCHDLINPVGALSTGLEVLEEETDEVMRTEAMRLISVSARKAASTAAWGQRLRLRSHGLGETIAPAFAAVPNEPARAVRAAPLAAHARHARLALEDPVAAVATLPVALRIW